MNMHPDKLPSTRREHFVKKPRFIKETSAPWNSQSKRWLNVLAVLK